MPTADGLRERRKRTTRQSLEDAALRLFARDGFDATTIEAIAAEADVSPRTFFRYFTTKDQVLNPEKELRQVHLREAVLSLDGPGLSDLEVAVEALARIAPAFEGERETMLLRRRAALSSPVLRGRLYDALHSWERAVISALAERRGAAADDLTAEMAGAAAVALWQHAVQRWTVDVDATVDLAAHLRAAHAALKP